MYIFHGQNVKCQQCQYSIHCKRYLSNLQPYWTFSHELLPNQRSMSRNKSGSAARWKRELCDHMVDFKCILPKKSIAVYQEMYHRRRITLNYMVGFEKRCTIKWFTWRDTSNDMVALKSFKPHQEIYQKKVRVVVPSVRLRTTALRPRLVIYEQIITGAAVEEVLLDVIITLLYEEIITIMTGSSLDQAASTLSACGWDPPSQLRPLQHHLTGDKGLRIYICSSDETKAPKSHL